VAIDKCLVHIDSVIIKLAQCGKLVGSDAFLSGARRVAGQGIGIEVAARRSEMISSRRGHFEDHVV
jgi:hypothetical protein